MSKERKPTKQEERLMKKYPETTTFLWHNENPKGHITGDCAIRALAGATGMTWCEALDAFTAMMKRYAVYQDKAIEKYLESQGWVKHKQPRHDDGSKWTGSDLAKYLSINDPDGKIGGVFVTVANHSYCIRPTRHGDGINCRYKVLDIWDSTQKRVCNYWTKPQ